ncbi:hypothetical protein Dimus_011790 [Dionaea muscipula]
MERKNSSSSSSRLILTNIICFCILLLVLCFIGSVDAYENYTVGDSLGWYDKLENPNVDYQQWVAHKSFSLGDFLIFNTDNNHSIIRTYNFSTYKACDYSGDDITEWSATDPSATTVIPVTIAIPLVKEGMTYFFSGDYDGEQCKHGQRFKVNVTHGQGLPPSLRETDSSSSPAPANPDADNPESAPDTTVSSNFDHPKNSTDSSEGDDDGGDGDAKKQSGCSSVSGGIISAILVLFGLSSIL